MFLHALLQNMCNKMTHFLSKDIHCTVLPIHTDVLLIKLVNQLSFFCPQLEVKDTVRSLVCAIYVIFMYNPIQLSPDRQESESKHSQGSIQQGVWGRWVLWTCFPFLCELWHSGRLDCILHTVYNVAGANCLSRNCALITHCCTCSAPQLTPPWGKIKQWGGGGHTRREKRDKM